MKTFKHNGKLGDIIFSLPTIAALGGGVLYVPEMTAESPCIYSQIKDLLLQQNCIHDVIEYPSGLAYLERAPGIAIDYDLDEARLQPNRGATHLILRYLDAFGITKPDWYKPFLNVGAVSAANGKRYAIINLTERFREGSNVNWGAVLERAHRENEDVFFVGTKTEHDFFCRVWGGITYVYTADVLHLAYMVAGAAVVYCNQSLCLALAQAIGVRYFFERKPNKTNCVIPQHGKVLL